jgi:predicted alpha/beta-hydrolase family hydrolase
MPSETLTIPVDHPRLEHVGALLDGDKRPATGTAVLLAHGAGQPMDSAFMADVADGLATRGFAVLRFNYPFMERAVREDRRFPPDRRARLEAAHRAALRVLRERVVCERTVLGGKSMGGRIASHLVAEGTECAGLLFLGYPLHPAGKPERLRSEHFPDIGVPSLFLRGTRDRLCESPLLARALPTLGAPARRIDLEGADHGFDVLVRSGRTRAQILERLLDEAAAWMRSLP